MSVAGRASGTTSSITRTSAAPGIVSLLLKQLRTRGPLQTREIETIAVNYGTPRTALELCEMLSDKVVLQSSGPGGAEWVLTEECSLVDKVQSAGKCGVPLRSLTRSERIFFFEQCARLPLTVCDRIVYTTPKFRHGKHVLMSKIAAAYPKYMCAFALAKLYPDANLHMRLLIESGDVFVIGTHVWAAPHRKTTDIPALRGEWLHALGSAR